MFFVDIEEENNYRIELLSSMLNVYIDYSEPEKAKKIYEQISTITDIDEETFIKRFEYFGKYINFVCSISSGHIICQMSYLTMITSNKTS